MRPHAFQLFADAAYAPDRDTAHRELVTELTRPEYARALPNPLLEFLGDVWDEFLAWVNSLNALAPNLGWLAVLAVAAAVAAVLVLFVRPRLALRSAPADRAGAVVGLDTSLSAADYRARADRALVAADYATAVLDRFRALVVRAEERSLLDPQPGRTATEVSSALGLTFGPEAPGLARAADLFNAVHYGHHEPSAADARMLAGLEERLSAAAPGGAADVAGNLAVPR